VDGVGRSEGVPLNQVAGQQENLIPQVHSNVGLPIALELPARQGIPAFGKVAVPALPCQARVDFGIGPNILTCCSGCTTL